MNSQDLCIHGYAEIRKAIGHMHAAMEYIQWLNYHGAPTCDVEREEKFRAQVENMIEELEELIG
jgi:hypothetical protein